jgi:hypothetical protein
MARNHQPDQADFKVILPEDIDWKPFPAFPPQVRLAVVIGDPGEAGPYVTRVKAPGGTKLMPHKHPEDRIYTARPSRPDAASGQAFSAFSRQPIRAFDSNGFRSRQIAPLAAT